MIRPIPARRHPDQVLLAALLVVSGLPILFGGPRPGSVSATLPEVLVYLWAGVLVLGGALIVAAAVVRSPEVGLYIELAAHPPVAVMMWVYALSALVVGGGPAAVAAALIGGFGLARTVRTVQVLRSLAKLRTDLKRKGPS